MLGLVYAMGFLRKEIDTEKMRNEGNTKALVGLLKHKDRSVRREAAKALRELRDPGTAPALVESLAETDAITFLEKVRALESIGAPAIDILLRALGNDESNIRRGAIAVLGRIREGRAVKPIIRMLKHESSPDLKRTEITALGRIGSAEALDQLIRELKKLLPKVTFVYFEDTIDTEKDVACIVLALKQFGQASVAPLESLLSDPNENVSKGAREILERKFHWRDQQSSTRRRKMSRARAQSLT